MKNDHFALWLKEKMQELGLSTSGLAEISDITSTTISKLRSGERLPGSDHIHKLSKALRINAGELEAIVLEQKNGGVPFAFLEKYVVGYQRGLTRGVHIFTQPHLPSEKKAAEEYFRRKDEISKAQVDLLNCRLNVLNYCTRNSSAFWRFCSAPKLQFLVIALQRVRPPADWEQRRNQAALQREKLVFEFLEKTRCLTTDNFQNIHLFSSVNTELEEPEFLQQEYIQYSDFRVRVIMGDSDPDMKLSDNEFKEALAEQVRAQNEALLAGEAQFEPFVRANSPMAEVAYENALNDLAEYQLEELSEDTLNHLSFFAKFFASLNSWDFERIMRFLAMESSDQKWFLCLLREFLSGEQDLAPVLAYFGEQNIF